MIDLRNHIEILDLDIDSVLCRSIKFRDLLFDGGLRNNFYGEGSPHALESIIASCYEE
jgi:hypothetical protein